MNSPGDASAASLDGALPDIDWSVLPPGVERIAFGAPSGSLAGIAAGAPDGIRVVLVSGATGSKEDFLLMVPLLATAGCRVESFDLAGQFESAGAGPENLTPPRARYDLDLFVDDLIAVLEAGRTPAHVLGYSFAATVAQVALQRRPELFATIAFLSAPPVPGQVFRSMKRFGLLSRLASAGVGASLMIWASPPISIGRARTECASSGSDCGIRVGEA